MAAATAAATAENLFSNIVSALRTVARCEEVRNRVNHRMACECEYDSQWCIHFSEEVKLAASPDIIIPFRRINHTARRVDWLPMMLPWTNACYYYTTMYYCPWVAYHFDVFLILSSFDKRGCASQ